MGNMISTAKGFKMYFDPVEYTADGVDFITTAHTSGLWVALTGKTFWVWVQDGLINTAHLLIENADILLVPALALSLGAMAGSDKSKKWLFYNVIAYIVIKSLGVYV